MTATALTTDLYQLSMAQGYWKLGRADQPAVFHLFFRTAPFGGGYAIAAGLAPALDFVRGFRFTEEDTGYLATIGGNDGRPLFDAAFLAYLRDLRLTVDIDALPEGTACFAHAPMLRVRGPLLQGQLLETALLNLINFQTLIATKAARVKDAAGGDAVLEFGLRRAQGTDGALAASRAAYLGGVDATSHVAAGRAFGIPVKGTHAHSWVMSFDTGGRGRSLRCLGRHRPEQRRLPRRHLRHARAASTTRSTRAGSFESRATASAASASTRATSPGSAVRRGRSSTPPASPTRRSWPATTSTSG